MYVPKNIILSYVVLIFIFSTQVFAQQEYITVIGDSLVGKMINGESIREIFGNVILTQGKVTVTCDQAIQYIARNDAELIGNVIAKQDQTTITTSRGFYYGNQKRTISETGVRLDDGEVILTAVTGEYFFDEDKAFFRNNVRLYDTVTTLTSDSLLYFKKEDRTIATGGVRIVDQKNTIESDTLEHFRNSRITFASSRVKISSSENNVVIYGDHLEDYSQKSYTLIDRNPLLIQVDTTESLIDSVITISLDTLIISSQIMESFRDTINMFYAKDSVKILRGDFASSNDLTIYYRDIDKIVTSKQDQKSRQPVLWQQNSQLTGDSVTIYLREKQIRLMDVDKNTFILSRHEIYKDRFDQTSGDRVSIHFRDKTIEYTEIFGSVYSIYYFYENDEPNGLTKSTSKNALISFEDRSVSEVRLYGSPSSEYYPENQVAGKEMSFTLPKYVFYPDRPVKEDLISDWIYRNDEKNKSNHSSEILK